MQQDELKSKPRNSWYIEIKLNTQKGKAVC